MLGHLPLKPPNSKMRIPEPDVTEDGIKYYPLVRLGHFEPFGYRVDPEDPMVLQPVPNELFLLEQAKKHLKHYSLRDVSAWLSHQSGRYISHQGLKDRVKADTKREKEYANSKHIAKQLAHAYKKARRVESSRLGSKEPTDKSIREEILKIVGETSSD